MIYSIKSDKPSFNPIYFNKGFNIILADRTKQSSDKDSRNGLGKSTSIEIIHFCLGGGKGETLSKPQLNDWTFAIEIDIGDNKYSVSRNTSKPNKIYVDGDFTTWPLKPEYDEENGKSFFSRNGWVSVLGVLMFNIPDTDEYKYHPSFRSIISYFIRKNGHSGAFLNPFQHFKNQKEWDIQVNNAFLLGLGWEFSSSWQVLKDRKAVLNQIKEEAKTGIISNLLGNIGELEAKKVRLESQVKQERENLNSFKVHPQYQNIEDEANNYTVKIHENINLNVESKRLLEHYEKSIVEEIDAKPEALSQVYREAGVYFADILMKKIEEVQNFHNTVVQNRKEYLLLEIEKLKEVITIREQGIKSLTDKRAELLEILNTHGALEERRLLENNHQETVAQLKDVSIKIDNLKRYEQGKSALTVDQELLQQKTKNDLSGRQIRDEAMLAFNSYSQSLYDTPGTLSINVEKSGYKFDVIIERSGSHGVGNMKIFCYDLVLARLWAKRTNTPKTLMHDSIIFADVDERQKARAIQLAKQEAEQQGFQYICTMNSDSIPINEFDKDFNYIDYVVSTFTDDKENGGLLGIRF